MTSNDQTPSANPDPLAGATFRPGPGGAGTLTTADGTTHTVPGDLPQRADRYKRAIEAGRQVNSVIQQLYLPELREFMAIVAEVADGDPYAPGGGLFDHAVTVAALMAFADAVATGQAAHEGAAALTALTPPAAP